MGISTRMTIDGPWGKPVKFDPVNSPTGDGYLSYSTGDSHLYFGRGYPLTRATYDVWQVEVLPIVDFNGDNKVDGLDLIVMGMHWGEDYSLCDIAPLPFGDGVVDVQDLLLLAEYMDPMN